MSITSSGNQEVWKNLKARLTLMCFLFDGNCNSVFRRRGN
jgi:hypothetical protein